MVVVMVVVEGHGLAGLGSRAASGKQRRRRRRLGLRWGQPEAAQAVSLERDQWPRRRVQQPETRQYVRGDLRQPLAQHRTHLWRGRLPATADDGGKVDMLGGALGRPATARKSPSWKGTSGRTCC